MIYKKVLSLFIAVALVCTAVPVSAIAQIQDAYADPLEQITSEESKDSPHEPSDDPEKIQIPGIELPPLPEKNEEIDEEIDEGEEDLGSIDFAEGVFPGDGEDKLDLSEPLEESFFDDDEELDDENDLEPLSTMGLGLAPGTYVFRSALARNMVFDIEKASKAARANLRMWTSNMTNAQRFKITFDKKGYATIQNINSGKVLDVAGGVAKARTNVWQYGNNNTKAQKWIIHSNADGTYTFESALKKGLVLDVAGGSSASGANLQVYNKNNTFAQKFYALDPTIDTAAQGRTIADGVYTISTALDSKKIIDIAGGVFGDGTTAQIYNINGTLAQKFHVKLNSRGYYSIRAYHSGKALSVENGNIVPSTRVIQKLYDSNDKSQDWIISSSSSGRYTIMARTGLVMDVKGGTSAARTPIWMYGANGTKAQQWTFTADGDIVLPEGVCTIKPWYTTKVFDIADGSKAQNTPVQIYRSNNTLAQRFLCTKVSTGIYSFQALNSGCYLTENGGKLVQQKNMGSDSQKWRVELAFGGYVFYNLQTGNAMSVSGNGTADKSKLSVSAYNAEKGQKFIVAAASSFTTGYYKITVTHSGQALEIPGSSKTKGTNARAFTSNSKNDQKWYVTSLGGDYYKIASAPSGYVLDVANATKKVGTKVRQWHWNGTAAQKWKAVPSGDGNFYFKSALGEFYLGIGSGGSVCLYTADKAKAHKFRLSATSYSPVPASRQAMDNRVNSLASPTGWLLAIDSTSCRVGVYKGSKGNWKNVYYWACSPGKPSTPTVKGMYSVTGRGYSFGSGYTCYYWTQFYGNYLFHSVLYNQGTRTIQDGTLGKRVSHGCVRLDINNAKWIYDNIPLRTTVLSY